MDEKYLAPRLTRQAVESEGTFFLIHYFCLGRIHEYPRSLEVWKEKTEWFTKCNEHRQVVSIDGEPAEFEWTNCPKTHNTAVTSRDPKDDGRDRNPNLNSSPQVSPYWLERVMNVTQKILLE